MYRPTTSIILDVRKPVKSGKYSVKLRVTFKKGAAFEQVYYPLKLYFGKKEFEQIRKSPKDAFQKEYRDQMALIEQRAWKIAGMRGVFDRASFEAIFLGSDVSNSLQSYFDRRIADLRKAGRGGTANIAQAACNSFYKFKSVIYIADIDTSWIESYEAWMLEKERSYTTIGINLRELRRVLNLMIKNGDMEADLYPFHNFTIKSERKLKVPLSEEEVEKLKNFKSDNPDQMKGVAFWLFSYYCNGLNPADILSLKWRQIQGKYLIYSRQKTKRTNTIKRDIVIHLRPEVLEIIKKYGNPDGEFIFDFLQGVTNTIEEIKRVNRWINEQIKPIGESLGIGVKLTLGIARHSFSNKLLQAGIGKEFIQYALGHGDMKTTENYLAGFKLDKIKEVSDLL